MSENLERPDFVLKKGETHTPLDVFALDADGARVGFPAGSTVLFRMWPVGSDTTKVSASAAIVDVTAVVGDPDYGEIRYTFSAGNVDTPGWYYADFKVTYADASVGYFPNDEQSNGHLLIQIRDTR